MSHRAACRSARSFVLVVGGLGFGLCEAAEPVPVDMKGYDAGCGVAIRREGHGLELSWPMDGKRTGRLQLDLRPGEPLISLLGFSNEAEEAPQPILRGVDPVTFVTVGTRVGEAGRPPGMSAFNAFFDAPATRPHQSHRSRLDLTRARVSGEGRRATVALGDLTIGPFSGELRLTVYPGARLVQVEAVVKTEEKGCAFLYDAGLVGRGAGWHHLAYREAGGGWRRQAVDESGADEPRRVRHRALVAEGEHGSLACFPPPHKYFFARDLTDNLSTAWAGRGHRGLEERFGFGIRQSESGGGSYAPWFNAPAGTDQHLSVFYLIHEGDAEKALDEVLRYSHGDRFPELPGHRTLTSHWHMAITAAAMQERARGGGRSVPDWAGIFKGLGVNAVHLAEFHGDGHPQDPGRLRLPEMAAMVDECRRLSDGELLLLPGEEANVHLGPREPGRNPGHWLYLFPRPVTWTMRRAAGQPFEEVDPKYGTVYHVGNREDMVRLLEREHGLAWTAHPRIKASTWAPDVYREEDFYRSDLWLGAAWKAMPVDLSRPRLGERALDLLDDMANWGGHKQLIGEVDVFKIDPTHELYAHMNVNYLRLDSLPRFDESWQPVLDALRGGHFFVTTGEVLIRDFRVDGRESGSTLKLAAGGRPEVRLELEWTFPLRAVEIVTGDGTNTRRQAIELADTEAFGRRTLSLRPDAPGPRWLRVEAWDVAGNGAFSQPVWLEPAGRAGP